jgi:hypothetical protein
VAWGSPREARGGSSAGAAPVTQKDPSSAELWAARGCNERRPTTDRARPAVVFVEPRSCPGGSGCVLHGARGRRRRIAEPVERGVGDRAGGHEPGLVLRRSDLARACVRGWRVLPAARRADLRPSTGRAAAGTRATGPGQLSRDPDSAGTAAPGDADPNGGGRVALGRTPAPVPRPARHAIPPSCQTALGPPTAAGRPARGLVGGIGPVSRFDRGRTLNVSQDVRDGKPTAGPRQEAEEDTGTRCE